MKINGILIYECVFTIVCCKGGGHYFSWIALEVYDLIVSYQLTSAEIVQLDQSGPKLLEKRNLDKCLFSNSSTVLRCAIFPAQESTTCREMSSYFRICH